MKRKITGEFILMTLIAIIASALITAFIFYRIAREEILVDLKNCAKLVEAVDLVGGDLPEIPGLRVTIISEDGTAVYDSFADTGLMGNHRERPEVAEAFASGEGQIIRESETAGKIAFYYALRVSGGEVVRVARDVSSMAAFIAGSLPLLILLGLLLFIVCFFLAQVLTASILRPIVKIAKNPDANVSDGGYEELTPIVEMIREQHELTRRDSVRRQEFTTNVSHELKTPLAAISGYAELVANGMGSEADMRRYGRDIHRNAERLLSLINDVIRLSELDISEEDLRHFVPVDLAAEAEKCCEMLIFQAEKRNVTVSYEGVRDKSCTVYGDPQMLSELVYNLCDNAVRYNNPGGSVTVSVHTAGGEVLLTVKDTGIGIPEKDRKRIFERFYRVDKSRSRETGGTGLGLAIVKHIVEQHPGASISMGSEVGKGTEITVRFPKMKGE